MLFRVVLCLVLVTGTLSFSFSDFLHRRNIHQRNTQNRRNEGELRMTVRPDDWRVETAGDELMYFYCKAEGNPPPQYTWYKDNMKIRHRSGRYFIQNEPAGDGSSIIIERLSLSDAGEYTCVADNGVSNVSATANATVTTRAHEWGPKFKSNSATHRVRTGAKVRLYCSIKDLPEEAPAAEIFWLRDWHPFDEMDSPRVHIAEEGSLIFETAEVEDTSKYTCVTRNEYGSDVSFAASLVVCDSKDSNTHWSCKYITNYSWNGED